MSRTFGLEFKRVQRVGAAQNCPALSVERLVSLGGYFIRITSNHRLKIWSDLKICAICMFQSVWTLAYAVPNLCFTFLEIAWNILFWVSLHRGLIFVPWRVIQPLSGQSSRIVHESQHGRAVWRLHCPSNTGGGLRDGKSHNSFHRHSAVLQQYEHQLLPTLL